VRYRLKRNRGVVLGACFGVWLAVCAAGAGVLMVYSNRPGPQGTPNPVPTGWPLADAVPLDGVRPTLVVFAHPRCPCTKATLSQIERLQASARRGFAVRFAFYEPVGAGADWRDTALWRRAAMMPDSLAVPDPGGGLALACGAMTSGTVGLYGPDGAVRFWGGVTPSRGHEGESVGLAALREILRGEDPGRRTADVFGCSILGSCGVSNAGGA